MSSETAMWIEKLKHSRTGFGRAGAAEKLGEIGDARAVEPLIESLQDENSAVRSFASGALVQIGDLKGIVVLLKHRVRTMEAVQALAGLDPSRSGQEVTVGDLKEIDNAEVGELLIQALRDKDVKVRAMAALALGSVKDNPRVVEALRRALDDDQSVLISSTNVAIPLLGLPQSGYSVAEVAGLSLVRLGDKESTKRIVQLALKKCPLRNKEDFFRFMFRLGWESVVAELALMREHNHPSSRWRAVSWLAAIGDAQVIGPLIGFLDDEDTDVRKKAVQALGEIGNSSVLEVLTQATQDGRRAVRRAAKKAIKQIEAKNS